MKLDYFHKNKHISSIDERELTEEEYTQYLQEENERNL